MKLFSAAMLFMVVAACDRGPQAYLERGNKFFDSGKYEDAALQYQKALQKSPDLGEAHYRMGLVNLRRNMFIPAYQELQKSVQLMPENNDAAARLAELSLVIYNSDPSHPAQLFNQASQAARKLIGKDPGNFDGNVLSGTIALMQSHPDTAVKYFRTAVQKNPSDQNAKLGLARALAKNNQVDAADAVVREMIAKDKTFSASYDFLVQEYGSAGKWDEVERVFKLKAANNPRQPVPVLELARFYAMTKKPAEMNATVQTLVNNPTFPQGRLLAGDFYLNIGNAEEALKQYNAGLSANDKDKTLYRKRLSHIYSMQRNWPAAGEQIDAVLKQDPKDEDARMMRALVWMDEGKPENLDAATKVFRDEMPKHPQDPVIPFQLGNALARKGDIDGARNQWTASAKLKRDYVPARYALAQLYLEQGKGDYALRTSEEILAITPKDPGAQLLHAACLASAGQFQVARGELNRLATQYPKSPDVRYRFGMLALAEHKYKEAETVFRELARDQATTGGAQPPQIAVGLAQALTAEGETAAAMQVLQDSLAKSPDSPVIRRMLASVAAKSGNYDLAIGQYREMAAASPGAAGPQFSLAEAYAAKGDANSAIPILKKMVDADPKNMPASLELIQTYLAAGRVDEAKTLCRRVLQSQPHDPNALNDMAYLMAESGENLDQALTYAQQGMQFATDSNLKEAVSDTLGWIYVKKRMYPEALMTFRGLVARKPDDPTYRYHLGVTLFESGDKQKARTELEAALAANPQAQDQGKIRQLLAKM